jgi:hypothetical protein
MKPEKHLECEVQATVKVYRAERNFPDVDSHFSPIIYPCSLLEICLIYPEQVIKSLGYQKEKSSSEFDQNWSYPNMKKFLCKNLKIWNMK